MSSTAQTLLVLALLAAAALKLRDPSRGAAALATYGIGRGRVRTVAFAALVACELALAGGLVASTPWSAPAAVALFGAFGLASTGALAAGRAGRPCACFGAGARLTRLTPLAALAGGLLALALAEHWLSRPPSTFDRALAGGLAVALVSVAALALTVFALAREVGVLRLSLSSQGALEIPGEGPAIGERQDWAAELPSRPGALVGLAVFSSDGCPMCRRLAPAISYVAADPLLAVRVFDEVADAATWAAAAVPGSPYAVALDASGVARAKGTFNSLVQLEGIVSTARAREADTVLAG
jgi:hypothetical protein